MQLLTLLKDCHYCVLVDLGEALANELSLPFDEISLEMVYRGLNHFTMAHQKGQTTDPVKYFADPKNRDLGIVKQSRKPHIKLIVAPFPERQRGSDQFFFHSPPLDCIDIEGAIALMMKDAY